MPTLLVACMIASAIGVGAIGIDEGPGFSPGNAGAPDLFDEIYARGKPLETTLKSLTARFTETSQSPLLAKPLVARGTISVIRPSRVAMHYTMPESRTVIIDGARLRVVWPSHGIDRTTPIGAMEKRIQQYFVDTSPKQLRSHFDIAAQVATDRPNAWFLTMKPRRKQIREGLSQLELWIQQDTVMLAAMRMVFSSGDAKLLEFEDVLINPPIDESAFRPRKD
jgi:outer membrane lipoprotein-sorting protein